MDSNQIKKIVLDPCILIVAGVTGDLSRRYLLPALYELFAAKILPENFTIVGLSRRNLDVNELIESIKTNQINNNKEVNPETIKQFEQSLEICLMDISKPDDYQKLKDKLDKIEENLGVCLNRLFYLAIPPEMFEKVISGLGTCSLNNGCNHGSTESRLLLEKPFGQNTASAKELVAQIQKSFKEDQVYRVDHYLAKENAQNILAFRFLNPLFSRIWDNKSIEYITITANESLKIENRAQFYEQTGALRDFIQSHLIQLMSLVTMEEPYDNSSKSLHEAKLKLLNQVVPISAEDVQTSAVRGQYEGYSEEVSNPETTTETYAAIKLTINNERWKDVPILLRTGKALDDRISEINFKLKSSITKEHTANMLTIRIQPNEGISLSLAAKKPGFGYEIQQAQMQFCYDQQFTESLPNAYEYVLVDAMRGDQSLFSTAEEIIRSWEIIENVINDWSVSKNIPELYKVGSSGPISAEIMANNSNATWETNRLKIC